LCNHALSLIDLVEEEEDDDDDDDDEEDDSNLDANTDYEDGGIYLYFSLFNYLYISNSIYLSIEEFDENDEEIIDNEATTTTTTTSTELNDELIDIGANFQFPIGNDKDQDLSFGHVKLDSLSIGNLKVENVEETNKKTASLRQ
jgi:hypothetical protein